MGSDVAAVALVTMLGDLADRLDAWVVAEGVEDEATLEMLQRLGCDVTQGFLHARPMPPDYFVRWLQTYDPTLPPTELVDSPVRG